LSLKNQNEQQPIGRLESIITELQAEYTNLLRMNFSMRTSLEKEEAKTAELELHVQHLTNCLQIVEQRSWRREEQLNKLRVQVAFEKAETQPIKEDISDRP
jgi:O-methyltransferase involved in polyketide biosynthesis